MERDAISLFIVGEVIRPQVSVAAAQRLVENLYGLTVTKIKELDSYDDRNFKVEVSSSKNPHIVSVSPHGYTLKILNSKDSPSNHVCKSTIFLFYKHFCIIFFHYSMVKSNAASAPIPTCEYMDLLH